MRRRIYLPNARELLADPRERKVDRGVRIGIPASFLIRIAVISHQPAGPPNNLASHPFSGRGHSAPRVA